MFHVARLVVALTSGLKFHLHLHMSEYTNILYCFCPEKKKEEGKEGRKKAVPFISFNN